MSSESTSKSSDDANHSDETHRKTTQTTIGGDHRGTFPAFEEHKARVEGPELLVELAPETLEHLIEWLFDTDYLDDREAILETRAETETKFTNGIKRVEATYGAPINRVLDRRLDGVQPTFRLDDYITEVNDAKTALDRLLARVDEDYLLHSEQRYLTNLESEIIAAREYLRNKQAFDRSRTTLQADIDAFENRFETYSGQSRYMIGSDQEKLTNNARSIYEQIRTLAREIDLQILAENDAEWLRDYKARFEQLTELLPRYNEAFVEQEQERHAELFETEHGKLNPSQQKAIIRNDRRNLVDASAGTGKTLTLTYRFMYLLRKGVAIDDIAAVTFTNDAADEMKQRIADQLDDVRESDLNISTIHKFANKIAQQNRQERNNIKPGEMQEEIARDYYLAAISDQGPNEADVIDQKAYQEFTDRIQQYHDIERQQYGKVTAQKKMIEDLTKFIENVRTFNLSPHDIRDRCPDADARLSAFGYAGAALVSAYQTQAQTIAGPVDFEEMLTQAIDTIQEYPIELGTKYDHILIDEFQDVSDVEVELFESLLQHGSETHLFCVGDDWQSIFGFRGSNVEIFTNFTDQPDTTYTSLSVNYRCPPTIVEAGAHLMRLSEADQNQKDVEADSIIEMTPKLHKLDFYDERAVTYTANLIETSLTADADREYDDVMVISQNDQNSAFMNELRAELEKRDIPHTRPNYQRDYIPDEYHDSLDRDIEFNAKGDVSYSDTQQHPNKRTAPPLVRLQSIYAAKGTEAPVVILAPAIDGDKDGIPTKERSDGLFEPVVANPANHLAEQRRLFYVALTRCEEEFHAIAEPGRVSRFIQELDEYFETVSPDIIGTCVSVKEPHVQNAPYKVTLDCEGYKTKLVGWKKPKGITVGETYHIPDPTIRESDYGVEIRFDQCDVVPVEET